MAPGSNVVINNSGTARGLGTYGFGLYARTTGPGGTNLLVNSGSVYGSFAGIYARSFGGTTIVDSGDISAGSLLAISVRGAAAQIYNSGHITGFVALTNSDDAFINEKGGVFETKLTSYFGGGNDLFRNEEGGTVLAATNRNASEYSSFVGLERFENKGLISLQDGQGGEQANRLWRSTPSSAALALMPTISSSTAMWPARPRSRWPTPIKGQVCSTSKESPLCS
jgi:autotransporter family porin